MNSLLVIGLSIAAGFVLGWAACLWFGLPKAEPDTAPSLLKPATKFVGSPHPSDLYGGRPPTTFYVAHSCRAEKCPRPEGSE